MYQVSLLTNNSKWRIKGLHNNQENIKVLIKGERMKAPRPSFYHELFEWWRVLAGDKHSEYCSSNVKVNIPSENKKWLKFNYGQHDLRFILCSKQTFEAY